MLYSASFLFRYFWLHASLHQQMGEEAVLFIGLLCYLSAYIGQAEKEVLIHSEKTALFQGNYRMAYAGFGDSHMPGHIHRAHHTFFFLEHQYSLQIVLSRRCGRSFFLHVVLLENAMQA